MPGRWRRHDGRALDVLVADLADVEALDVLDELPERLVEARERLALAGERRGPGEDEVLHVGVVDPALLELGHHQAERGVGRAHQLGALLALRQRLREVALQELVDAAQDRGEGPAREARIVFVEEAERDEVGRLELKRVVVLPASRLFSGEAPVHADHLEGLFLEVVRLLRVEREDLERDLGLGHEDGGDHLGLELGEHGAPVIAVRRPVETRAGRHHDDRIDEAVDLLHDLLEPLRVGRREVALVRRGLDLVQGQEAEDLPVLPHGIAVDGERPPAVALDLLGERGHRPHGLVAVRKHAPPRHGPRLCPTAVRGKSADRQSSGVLKTAGGSKRSRCEAAPEGRTRGVLSVR